MESPTWTRSNVDRDAMGARDGEFPHVVDGVFRHGGNETNPVLWATLDRHGITIRGPEAATLGAGPDPGWLREWNLGNLSSYRKPWAAGARATLLSGRDLDPARLIYAAVWSALGPGTPGEITSKTATADYTTALLPEYAPLLARAKASRRGDSTVTFSVADALAVCDPAEAVITVA
jgi:hypothetical protein